MSRRIKRTLSRDDRAGHLAHHGLGVHRERYKAQAFLLDGRAHSRRGRHCHYVTFVVQCRREHPHRLNIAARAIGYYEHSHTNLEDNTEEALRAPAMGPAWRIGLCGHCRYTQTASAPLCRSKLLS